MGFLIGKFLKDVDRQKFREESHIADIAMKRKAVRCAQQAPRAACAAQM
ncbi:hypothetical protein [Afipia carboxidovorans]|nr:hypothetical protein [Afipia carboxidovorans]